MLVGNVFIALCDFTNNEGTWKTFDEQKLEVKFCDKEYNLTFNGQYTEGTFDPPVDWSKAMNNIHQDTWKG